MSLGLVSVSSPSEIYLLSPVPLLHCYDDLGSDILICLLVVVPDQLSEWAVKVFSITFIFILRLINDLARKSIIKEGKATDENKKTRKEVKKFQSRNMTFFFLV